MLLEEIKKIQSDEQTLKKFGLLLSVFLAILAGISFWKGASLYVYSIPLAVVVLGFSLVIPKILKFIYLPWMAGATVIGWLMSHIILTILYYLVITPIGRILKLTNRDILDEKINPNKPSYWVPREDRVIDKRVFERQF
jgi:hypothetical protein